MLKNSVTYLGPNIDFLATDISERCLHASGANTLLNEHINPEVITLISRWRSDKMLQYLHVQNINLMKYYAACMLQHGDYNIIPTQCVPMK